MCWALVEELWSAQFRSLRDSVPKLPTSEKLIHTSVRSQGSPASMAPGFFRELKSSACLCINSLALLYALPFALYFSLSTHGQPLYKKV